MLVFWRPKTAVGVRGAPNVQLVGCERVEVKGGKTRNVTMRLDICEAFSLVDADGRRMLALGRQTVLVGAPSELQAKQSFGITLSWGTSEASAA